jgi:hypothetical protein
MKTNLQYYGLLLLALFFLGCEKESVTLPDEDQPENNFDCEPSPLGLDWFATDIYQQAIYVIGEEKDSLPELAVDFEMPSDLIDELSNVFGAFYDLEGDLNRDTIVDILEIHDLVYYGGVIGLRADTGLVWIEQMKNENYPTGEPIVDALIDELNLAYHHILPLPTYSILYLRVDPTINLHTVLEQLEEAEGVSYGWLSTRVGGTNIFTERENGNYYFTFTYGWGDCAISCSNNRFWEFKVSPDCEVEFLQSYGDILQ